MPEGKGGFDDGGNPVNGLFVHRTLLEMPNGDLVATAYGWLEADAVVVHEKHGIRPAWCCSAQRTRARMVPGFGIAVDPAVGQEGFTEPVLARLTQGKHNGRFIA